MMTSAIDIALQIEEIPEKELREFANNMQIYNFDEFKAWASKCHPKKIRKYLTSSASGSTLHQAAKHGAHDVVDLLLQFGKVDVNSLDDQRKTALHYAAWEGHVDIVKVLTKNGHVQINANQRDSEGNTPLHYAAKKGYEFIVKILLGLPKVNVNIVNDKQQMAIHLAAKRGHEKIVDILLDTLVTLGIELSWRDIKGNTPLHGAAIKGHHVIVYKLLRRVHVNYTNDQKQTALHCAASKGHEDVVDILLGDRNVDPSARDHLANTPLHEAAKCGHRAIVAKLLEMPKVDVNVTNKMRQTALHVNMAWACDEDVVETLLKAPNVNACIQDEDGNTPLHFASWMNQDSIVVKLLHVQEMDINVRNKHQKSTALQIAAYYGHQRVVDILLGKQDVKVWIQDYNGDCALHDAAREGHEGVVEKILATPNVDVNITNDDKQTPLHLGSKGGHTKVVYMLLNVKGVDPCMGDSHGNSPLHEAARSGHKDVVTKILTSHPSREDVNATNNYEETALHFSVREGHEDVVNILLEQHAIKATIKDCYGEFPLHHAARKGHEGIFQRILRAPGVDVNGINQRCDTALHIAAKEGHVGVVDILLKETQLNASIQDRDGNLPLHIAARNGEETIVHKLLAIKGVDVNARGENGATALLIAAMEGHANVVDELLKAPDVDETIADSKDMNSPLLIASERGHVEVVKNILHQEVDVNDTSRRDGMTALFLASLYGHVEIVDMLLKARNVDPNRREFHLNRHPLHVAAEHGHGAVVEKLLGVQERDVNVSTREGNTALHLAARNGREKVLQILLKEPGINICKKNKKGETALFSAARSDNKFALKEIYKASKVNVGSAEDKAKKKMDVNEGNHKGQSIIHLAALKGSLNVIDFLLEVFKDDAGSVDVNKTISQETAFVNDGNTKENCKDLTALDIAIQKGHYIIVEKLTKFDTISFTAEDEDGITRLQRIFYKDKREIFKILRRTPEVKDYIDALYKDRQASVDAANAILVGAALIASVTFASWLQPPLGYITYYHEQFVDTFPAPPVSYPQYVAFDHHPILRLFWAFNSLSFFCATATVISGARSVLPARKVFIKQEVVKLRKNLLVTSILLGFSMLFVLLAFAMAGIVVLPPVSKYRANIFSTIALGGSLCVVFLFLLANNIYELLYDIINPSIHDVHRIKRQDLKPKKWYLLCRRTEYNDPFTKAEE